MLTVNRSMYALRILKIAGSTSLELHSGKIFALQTQCIEWESL